MPGRGIFHLQTHLCIDVGSHLRGGNPTLISDRFSIAASHSRITTPSARFLRQAITRLWKVLIDARSCVEEAGTGRRVRRIRGCSPGCHRKSHAQGAFRTELPSSVITGLLSVSPWSPGLQALISGDSGCLRGPTVATHPRGSRRAPQSLCGGQGTPTASAPLGWPRGTPAAPEKPGELGRGPDASPPLAVGLFILWALHG